MTTQCEVCERKIDPDASGVVTDGDYSYRHVPCDLEVARRHKNNLCLSCGKSPINTNRNSCEKCGVSYEYNANRKYTNV